MDLLSLKDVVHRQTYVYQPLSGKLCIRVAEIQPGSYENPLQAKLHETELPTSGNRQARPKYETLSYEWGEPTRIKPMACDGKTVLITKNLEAALLRIRSTEKPLRIWIDSLCIDQDNIPERNHQVSLMPLIYKSGSRVYMWIGEETASTPEALEMMEALQSLELRIKAANPPAALISSINALQKIVGGDLNLSDEKPERWAALNDVMSRTYFQRTWIAQEIILSWGATVVCGTYHFPWYLLRDAALCCMKCECLPVIRESSSYFQLVVLALFDSRLRRRKIVLVDLLQQFRYSRCGDPRDHVYGVMGMAAYPLGAVGAAQPLDIGLPPPDYSKSVEQVYQETTSAIIAQYGDLRVLFNIQAPRLRTYASMPSWVIDWSASPEGWWKKHAKPGQNFGFHDAAVFRENQVCNPTPHSNECLFPGEINIFGRLLITDGICLGKIDYVSMIIHPVGLANAIAKISEKLSEIYENTFFTQYVNAEPILEALAKTLLMNKNDFEAISHGFPTSPQGANDIGMGMGWTPMFESFFGIFVLDKIREKAAKEYNGVVFERFMAMALKESGAGLYLSAAKSLGNNRFFVTSTDLMGLASLEVQSGDSIIIIKGARAPLVLRQLKKEDVEWTIVGDAYVHAAMDVNDHVYTPELLSKWEQYRIG